MAVDLNRSILSVTVGAVMIVGLSGCALGTATPSLAPSGETTPSGVSASPSASETPIPEEAETFAFALPANCSGLLGEELETKLLGEGKVLLLGSDGTGLYAGRYAQSSQEVGTPLSCFFGKDQSNDYFEFDVQALTPDGYQEALKALSERQFTESADGDVKTFALVGAVDIVNAQVHALHPDGWITIASPKGGTSAFAEATELLAVISAQVFPKP
jgi:hypothetical protein